MWHYEFEAYGILRGRNEAHVLVGFFKQYSFPLSRWGKCADLVQNIIDKGEAIYLVCLDIFTSDYYYWGLFSSSRHILSPAIAWPLRSVLTPPFNPFAKCEKSVRLCWLALLAHEWLIHLLKISHCLSWPFWQKNECRTDWNFLTKRMRDFGWDRPVCKVSDRSVYAMV